MKLMKLALVTGIAFLPAMAFAQTTTTTPVTPAPTTATTPTPGKHDYNIQQRKENQQQRIANGVHNGTLNASQTSRLEHQEAGINKEESGMRAQDNGKLTKQDRKTIHQQQNQESRRIYRDKHAAKK